MSAAITTPFVTTLPDSVASITHSLASLLIDSPAARLEPNLVVDGILVRASADADEDHLVRVLRAARAASA